MGLAAQPLHPTRVRVRGARARRGSAVGMVLPSRYLRGFALSLGPGAQEFAAVLGDPLTDGTFAHAVLGGELGDRHPGDVVLADVVCCTHAPGYRHVSTPAERPPGAGRQGEMSARQASALPSSHVLCSLRSRSDEPKFAGSIAIAPRRHVEESSAIVLGEHLQPVTSSVSDEVQIIWEPSGWPGSQPVVVEHACRERLEPWRWFWCRRHRPGA
jgi:hypothetical protein